MIEAELKGSTVVEVSGLDLELLPAGAWRKALTLYGQKLQARIAESFDREQIIGSSSLKANSAKWNRYKAKHGLSPRRGHATGRTQTALEEKQFFNVSSVTEEGTATIEFVESKLYSSVYYVEYYAKKKTRTGAILLLTKKWVKSALPVLVAVELTALKRKASKLRELAKRASYKVGQSKRFANRRVKKIATNTDWKKIFG